MKSGMMRLVLVALLACGLTGPALAGDKQGCSPVGTWIGTAGAVPSWIGSNAGPTPNGGPFVLEVIGFDLTFGGYFPTAVNRPITLRGSWTKTGPNKSFFTATGFAVDADAQLVWIGTLSGHRTISGDCNSMLIEPVLEIFAPSATWATDGPVISMPMPAHYGTRVIATPETE